MVNTTDAEGQTSVERTPSPQTPFPGDSTGPTWNQIFYQLELVSPSPKDIYRSPKRILTDSWPGDGDGRRAWRFTDEAVYQFAFYKGNIPGFQEGIDLEVTEDDGSDAFAREHEALRAREATIVQDNLR